MRAESKKKKLRYALVPFHFSSAWTERVRVSESIFAATSVSPERKCERKMRREFWVPICVLCCEDIFYGFLRNFLFYTLQQERDTVLFLTFFVFQISRDI